MDHMQPFIVAENLYRHFGALAAVQGVNLRIGAGEIYGLVGPDGAGKTTLLRLLCGALRPDSPHRGSMLPSPVIRIAGYDVLSQTEDARAMLGYLPQRFSLYEDLTVIENIRFFAEVRGLPPAEWRPRCMEILEFVGLSDFLDRRAGRLSGGMKQKLGLAAALVHRPHVLLLDEPTTGVDPVTRQDFWQLIIRLVDQRNHDEEDEAVAVLMTTPYMDEASRCHRVGFMEKGHLLVEGAPEELRRRLEGRILELAGHPLPALRHLAARDPQVEDVQMFGDRLHLRVQPDTGEDVIRRLETSIPEQGAEIVRLRAVPPLLEDVFIALLESTGTPEAETEMD